MKPPFSLSKLYLRKTPHKIILAKVPINNASIKLLIGNQAIDSPAAFLAQGLKTPFSFTGNQSYLFSIHPFSAALEKKPFSALNCKASPNTKNVGSANIGANHLDLSIGLSASRMAIRTTVNDRKAIIPPIKGLATQDITTFRTTNQSIRDVLCCTSRIRPTPRIPPIIE